jgi:hypothetical protein
LRLLDLCRHGFLSIGRSLPYFSGRVIMQRNKFDHNSKKKPANLAAAG